jgi:hypothetical protein
MFYVYRNRSVVCVMTDYSYAEWRRGYPSAPHTSSRTPALVRWALGVGALDDCHDSVPPSQVSPGRWSSTTYTHTHIHTPTPHPPDYALGRSEEKRLDIALGCCVSSWTFPPVRFLARERSNVELPAGPGMSVFISPYENP